MEKKTSSSETEQVQYIETSTPNSLFEIYKSPEWDKNILRTFECIEKCKDEEKGYGDYPYFRPQNAAQFLPKLDKPSEIFSPPQLKELHSHLPYYHQYTNWSLAFTISQDGCALKSFYTKSEGINNSIIAVKDEDGNVFGAYASEGFNPTSNFSGTGETFLFTFYQGNRVQVFNATGNNEYYMYCDYNQICFGCSDDYFSLVLKDDFLNGYSKKTNTYDNECLNNKDKFDIIKMELWTFNK